MNLKFLNKACYCCQYLHGLECKLLLSLMITKASTMPFEVFIAQKCLMTFFNFERVAFMLYEFEHTELKGWFYEILALVRWKQIILVLLKKYDPLLLWKNKKYTFLSCIKSHVFLYTLKESEYYWVNDFSKKVLCFIFMHVHWSVFFSLQYICFYILTANYVAFQLHLF